MFGNLNTISEDHLINGHNNLWLPKLQMRGHYGAILKKMINVSHSVYVNSIIDTQ
jgi:hypothetical protein